MMCRYNLYRCPESASLLRHRHYLLRLRNIHGAIVSCSGGDPRYHACVPPGSQLLGPRRRVALDTLLSPCAGEKHDEHCPTLWKLAGLPCGLGWTDTGVRGARGQRGSANVAPDSLSGGGQAGEVAGAAVDAGGARRRVSHDPVPATNLRGAGPPPDRAEQRRGDLRQRSMETVLRQLRHHRTGRAGAPPVHQGSQTGRRAAAAARAQRPGRGTIQRLDGYTGAVCHRNLPAQDQRRRQDLGTDQRYQRWQGSWRRRRQRRSGLRFPLASARREPLARPDLRIRRGHLARSCRRDKRQAEHRTGEVCARASWTCRSTARRPAPPPESSTT